MIASKHQHADLDGASFDVAILGGGMAGLTLALQLRQELPDLSVAVFERTRRPLPEACLKVGESSVELASQYLERLGLKDYLLERHIVKFGLRFYPGGGHLPLEQRTEIGPDNEPIVRSYQLDRGVFESDMRERIEAAGATLVEGATVKELALSQDDGPHRVAAEVGGERVGVTARWVVDATGRSGLFKKRMKLKRGSSHVAHAGWFRIEGRLDVNTLVPEDQTEWHGRPMADQRWRSTNHFMGHGYWVWVIPLSSGHTSIGVVVHEEAHGFDAVRTLDRARAFIAEHEPVLGRALEGARDLDFLCLKGYSHGVVRSWSSQRWAVVGEAGAFSDPLYSPGSDLIAFANSFTTEIIRADHEGGDLDRRVRELNLQYRALVAGGLGIYEIAAPVYDHPRAMATKIYWDNFVYWCFPCQYFQQRIYALTGAEHTKFTMVGARYVQMADYVQSLLREWALLAPEEPDGSFIPLPTFPSVLVDAHVELQDDLTPDETLALMKRRAVEGEEIVGELLLRVVQELGPDKGRELLERAKVDAWDITIAADRLDKEAMSGLARRHALSKLARDVERNLGRVRAHADAAAARELLRSKTPSEAPRAAAR